MSETPEERAARIARVGPSLGDPGYLPYCGCPGLYRARRGKDSFECIFGRCGVGRTVNGIDMFDETAPDGPGFDWGAYYAAQENGGAA